MATIQLPTTNELKKGAKVILRNGWKATLEDNMKGNTRMATVEGYVTEMGSIYAHDITKVEINGVYLPVVHTAAQKKLAKTVAAFGF